MENLGIKKIIGIVSLFLIVGITHAQDIQFLYGYGNQKPVNFITTEIFKPLDCGPLYYFTDFKADGSGYFEAYTEISKYWSVGKGWSLTGQYNVGITSDGETAIRIDPVYLAGVSKSVKVKELTLSLDAMFRVDKFTNTSGAQFTFQFSRYWNKFQISGFCDLWSSGTYDPSRSTVVVLFEPQAFYKISKRFWIGAEGRLSNYTLLAPYDCYIMGGIKWNLEI